MTYKVRLTGQNRRIFDMLVRYMREGITSHDAQREAGVDRLASRINDLHHLGIQTRVESETVQDRFGSKATIARYFLVTKQPIVIVNEPVVRPVKAVVDEPVDEAPKPEQTTLDLT